MLTKILKAVSLLIIGFICGWCAQKKGCTTILPNQEKVDSIDNKIDINKEKIDSLNHIIDSIDSDKKIIQDSLELIKKEKKTEIKKIEELPLDSSVILLKKYLREYEEI